jgi:hypothetical protein
MSLFSGDSDDLKELAELNLSNKVPMIM